MADIEPITVEVNADTSKPERSLEQLERLTSPSVRITHEPLTYRRDTPASYFQDFLFRDKPGAQERLRQHANEMDVLRVDRAKAQHARLHAAGIEYRIEPNRTDGYGGYFSPPAWLNQQFATGRHAPRVLADLIATAGAAFPLPAGVSQVNIPIIMANGTSTQIQGDDNAVPGKGITDQAGTGAVVTISSTEAISLQLLEQSPAGAHMDYVIFKDMKESYDAQLEAQLIAGTGSVTPNGGSNQILGVINVPGITVVQYNSGSPTGPAMWPSFGQAVGTLADTRLLPPEVWLWRTGRFAWLMGQEDSQNRPLGLPSPFFFGNTDDSPDPITGIYGYPVFGDEAIPNTLTFNAATSTFSNGATINQDVLIALRPSDLMLFEGDFQVSENPDPLSGALGTRLVMHNYVAAITRYATSIAVVTGTGCSYPTAY
jgi:hypothetical protein